MTAVVIVALAAAVVLWRVRRRRQAVLSGLSSERPTFSVAPPVRWSTSGREHRL